EQRLAHGVGVREARDDDVEVVERLLRLALRLVGAAVLEQAARLLVGSLLRAERAREREQHDGERPWLHSFRPSTNEGLLSLTSIVCCCVLPSGHLKVTVWRPAASRRGRIGGGGTNTAPGSTTHLCRRARGA